MTKQLMATPPRGANLTIFNSARFGEIRTIEEKGKIYFCGKDVATALGYAIPRKAIADHCKAKGVLKRNTLTGGGRQELSFIDEGNLYRLITHSKLPDAEKFESWVFDEVLPSIRKTGGYGLREKNIEIREQNARIRTAQLLFKISERTQTEYKQVLHARITEMLTGERILPLPEVNELTYSAGEIGEMLGVSANKIGRLANTHGLKTEQYGKYFYDKAKTADKQVETFRYYKKVIEVFKSLLSAEV